MQDGQKGLGRLTGIDEAGKSKLRPELAASLWFSDIDTAKLDPTEYYSMLKQQARRIKPAKQNNETT